MNKLLLVVGTILAGIGLFMGGLFFSRANAQTFQPGWMMGNWNGQGQAVSGMMGSFGGQYGTEMMNGGMMGNEMMGSFDGLTSVDPLSIEEAESAVTDYLATLNNDDLSLGEIMIFDNHAYAQIVDESSDIGAFEVLVDPATGNVFPEPGPNMMWNTGYGMMGGGMMSGQFGSGMMGGTMMGNFGYSPDAEINVTVDEAVVVAQEYLDAYLPGKTADDMADAFPGYYTLHVLEDGETIGMLSVNAYTGQVLVHHWHGDFVEMAGEGHE
jgi:hypothetical protein